jgi:transposase
VKLLGPDLIVEPVAQPAKEPERTVLVTLTVQVTQHGTLPELWMDRGYLASAQIPALHAPRGDAPRQTVDRAEWRPLPETRVRHSPRHGLVECPAHQTAPILPPRSTAQFAADTCRTCALRGACTTAMGGRSISLHPEEALLEQLRAATQTVDGRATLRLPVTWLQ